jgi:outer membrane receptor protein involved in Fe transport
MRIFLLTAFICLFIGTQAQESGEVSSMEVIIEKDAEISLPESSRQFQRISEEKIVFDSLILSNKTYEILETEVDPFDLKYKALNFENANKLLWKPNYLKFGLGNFSNVLLEGAYNIDAKKAGHYSAFGFYDRFGSGPVDGKASKFSDLQINAKSYHSYNKLSINSKIDFLNNNFRFYGTPTGSVDLNDNPSINVRSFQLSTNLEGNRFDNIYFSIAPTFTETNFLEAGNLFNEETVFETKGIIRKKSKKNEWNYGVGLDQRQVSYTSGYTNSRSQFDIAPFVGLRGDYVTIKTGMTATLSKDSTNGQVKSNFYPSLDLTWNFDNQFTIYGTFSSGLEMVTLHQLQFHNAFLSDSLNLANRNVLADVKVEVSKRFNKNTYLKFGTRIELVENQFFLVNDTVDFRQFDMIYDPGTFTKIDFNLLFDFAISEKISVNSEIHFMRYNTSANLEPFHLPSFTYDLKASYFLSQNFRIGLDFNLIAGINGRGINLTSVTLDPIVDVGINANYKLNDRIELFLEANNLINQNYERYLNYPSLGLNGKFGFIFRF